MKNWLLVPLFVLLAFSVIGCGSEKSILDGFEKPDKIIEAINKNFDSEDQKLSKFSTEYNPVWRMSNGFQLSMEENSYRQGIALVLCYDAEILDGETAGSILNKIMKSIMKDDASKAIQQLQLGNDESQEVEAGEYILQKVSIKNLRIDPDEPSTFDLPVTFVRIQRKFDAAAYKKMTGYDGKPDAYATEAASLKGLEEIIRQDSVLKEAADYFRKEVKQEGVEPSHLDLLKIAQ
ncbi:hypothetical protein [Selenomonas ruminis]|uniref:Uncharacterized protein n=1 Tax=Selenomonas ruminis TaxID=2593411 RepID=A0A5D6W6C4_9FIRM|nr:hypothetical protein [Selenomonas sp. mPRGC5]TYZ23380.1 hypothetical protein FZ040_05735 [Selenomonas sp. mPRGC5]